MRVKKLLLSPLPLLLFALACQSTEAPPASIPLAKAPLPDPDPAEPTIRRGSDVDTQREQDKVKEQEETSLAIERAAEQEALREDRLARAISKALEYEINGQALLAIRTYRSAKKHANAKQREDLESKARVLLMAHLRKEKNRDRGVTQPAQSTTPVAAPVSAKPSEAIPPLQDYKDLSEAELIAVLKSSTPSERLRHATGGYNSFLAQAAAVHGQTLESKNAAYERLRLFRKNEARLARLRRARSQFREATRRPYKKSLHNALQVAAERFTVSDYLELFKLQDKLRLELAQSAKVVFRTRVVTRGRNGAIIGVGSGSQSRPVNNAEAGVLFGPHHRAQLRALRQARSFTPESVALLLKSENLRQQRVMLAASNEALRRRALLSAGQLAQLIESQP